MELQSVNADIAQNLSSGSKEETVQQLQNEFLIQVAEGKEAKEAFYDSIKAVKDKRDLDSDSVCFESKKMGAALAKTAVTPEEVSKWLDVMKKFGPMALAFVTWLDTFVASHKPQKEPPVVEDAPQTV